MFISFIVPVFNSQNTLVSLHAEINERCAQLNYKFELIFVEDGGTDNSWAVLQQLASKEENVSAIRLSRNFGQHNALLCGIRAAKGDILVSLDDDGQHPIDDLDKLLAPLDRGYDVVYGTPVKQPHNLARAFASRVTKLVLQNAIGAENADKVSAFRAFNRNAILGLKDFVSANVNLDVLLSWGTTKFTSVQLEHRPRLSGKSGYNFFKLVQHAMNMMTGFSTLPLQLASYIGTVFAFLGFISLIYIVSNYFVSGAIVPGFAFLGCLISIFSGVQLLTIGVIGEYLARVHLSTINRPPYLVRERID